MAPLKVKPQYNPDNPFGYSKDLQEAINLDAIDLPLEERHIKALKEALEEGMNSPSVPFNMERILKKCHKRAGLI